LLLYIAAVQLFVFMGLRMPHELDRPPGVMREMGVTGLAILLSVVPLACVIAGRTLRNAAAEEGAAA
jgi:hypothetical protein